jgi:hypothetical protein
MRRRVILGGLAVSAAWFRLAAAPAVAQTAPPMRVRGKIAAVEAQKLVVDSRDGQKIELLLADPLTVAAVKPVELASVEPGAYLGIATRTLPGGVLQALEVLVFPEAMRGASEGHFPWDLEQGSMMTNGTVTGTVQAASGRELNLKYKDGSQTISVPPGTPVVTFAPADRSDLKPGARVYLSATRNEQGQLRTARVTVEKDGVAPPM